MKYEGDIQWVLDRLHDTARALEGGQCNGNNVAHFLDMTARRIAVASCDDVEVQTRPKPKRILLLGLEKMDGTKILLCEASLATGVSLNDYFTQLRGSVIRERFDDAEKADRWQKGIV